MALQNAEIIFYPTAIGSEPTLETDSEPHWQRCMQGHAAANLIPVVASNRVGRETDGDSAITFYGSSFITDGLGEIIVQADRESTCDIVAEIDLDACAKYRREWSVFRDRRPEMYERILHH